MLFSFIQARDKSDFRQTMLRLHHLYISPSHSYFGHERGNPGTSPVIEKQAVECVEGRGIVGDRFFDYKANYKGQVTFFSAEVYSSLLEHFGLGEVERAPGVLRRNIIVSGQDLNELIGREFEIGEVRFKGRSECAPCHWMDHAFCPGAENWLKGRGGLRAQVLTSGILRVP